MTYVTEFQMARQLGDDAMHAGHASEMLAIIVG